MAKRLNELAGRPPALASLLEVSQALAGALELRASLHRVLERLERYHGVVRGAVTLTDPDTGDLYIEASIGLSAEGRKAHYKLGEGITGRVVQSGKPIVVPEVSREPLFLHRAFRGRKESEPGALLLLRAHPPRTASPSARLGVDLLFDKDRDYDEDTRLFSVVASMIGQALAAHRLLEDERKKLLAGEHHAPAGAARALRLLQHHRHLRPHAAGVRADRPGRSHQHHRPHPRRVRHRQGADRPRHPLQLHPRARSPSSRSTAPRCRRPSSRPSCSATRRAPSPAPGAASAGRFELADGGTLFLDEIGDIIPPPR